MKFLVVEFGRNNNEKMHLSIMRQLLTLLSALALAATAHAAGLNDTGFEAGNGKHPRQDDRYGRHPAATVGLSK